MAESHLLRIFTPLFRGELIAFAREAGLQTGSFSPVTYQFAAVVLSVLAITSVAIQLYVQICARRRVRTSDWLLITATCLLLINLAGYPDLSYPSNPDTVILARAGSSGTISIRWGLSLVAIKLSCFDGFFSALRNTQSFDRSWVLALVLLIPAVLSNEVAAWREDSTSYVQALLEGTTSSSANRLVRSGSITTEYEAFADLFLALLPICLLTTASMTKHQKLNLAPLFGVNSIMAVCATLRLAGTGVSNEDPDLPWVAFWHQAECGFSIMVASMSTLVKILNTEEERRLDQDVSASQEESTFLKDALDKLASGVANHNHKKALSLHGCRGIGSAHEKDVR